MTYTGLELFMEKLKQMIYCNDNPIRPIINNYPSILPQIQLLYEELSSMTQILFVDKENDVYQLEEVRNLKKRFKDAAEEAHDIVDLFVSATSFGNKRVSSRSYPFLRSLNLQDVMRSIECIKVELITVLNNNTNMDSSDRLKTQFSGTSCIRNRLGMKKVLEEVVVGIDDDAELIRDKLVEDRKQLDVISIVGMGGLGKTTLAAIVFNDRYVEYYFEVRVWVTVSQTYEKQDLLIQILSSIGIELDTEEASVFRLREKLHKNLMGQRYLIVIDDIWSIEAWDELKIFFPNDNNGSRILLTSRIKEVASHAKSHGFVHQLEYLTDHESWELLHKKVFHGNDCPKSLIKPGMQIAKNCHGLPLAVVVIAGVLAKQVSKDSWERIAKNVSSFIVSDRNRYVETLTLSYDHLPQHLRDCFLYLGGFPEDHKFRVRNLIWLWVAEGIIQKSRNRSLEETAEDYLMELVDRNLVVVVERKFNGAIKAFSIHDLLRELCLEKATKENFFLKINQPISSYYFRDVKPPKLRRIFTYTNFYIENYSNLPAPGLRSLLCFQSHLSVVSHSTMPFHSYLLLTVLDLLSCQLVNFPPRIALLVHLRYLAIWYPSQCFPTSICNLWSLQTLVIKRGFKSLVLPNNISNLVNLRHLWSDADIYFPSIEVPMNLQTISKVGLGNGAKSWGEIFPAIKKLTCLSYADEDNDFKSLTFLEKLKWRNSYSHKTRMMSGELGYQNGELIRKIHITLPLSLKKLTLVGCHLPWSDMSALHLLPKLEVLKILDDAFEGQRWETGKEQFRQLKFLKLRALNMQQWEACNVNFPCLKRLVLERCKDLKEIPLELGDIPTLELISIDDSSTSVVESLYRILEDQQTVGNYDLKMQINALPENRYRYF